MGNYPDYVRFEARFNRQRRGEYARWFNDPAFNVAMTLNFNSPVSLVLARKAVGDLFFHVDRKLIRTRRFTKMRDERTRGVFAFEHLRTNLHAHGLLQVKPERLEQLGVMFPVTQRGTWCDVWPSGSQWTTLAHDPGGFAYYFTKEQWASSDPETMLFLDQFFPTGG
jgi:hypothetical protein